MFIKHCLIACLKMFISSRPQAHFGRYEKIRILTNRLAPTRNNVFCFFSPYLTAARLSAFFKMLISCRPEAHFWPACADSFGYITLCNTVMNYRFCYMGLQCRVVLGSWIRIGFISYPEGPSEGRDSRKGGCKWQKLSSWVGLEGPKEASESCIGVRKWQNLC